MRFEAADIPPNTADPPTFQTRVILKAQLHSWAEMSVLKASLAKVSRVCCGEKLFPKSCLSGLSPQAFLLLRTCPSEASPAQCSLVWRAQSASSCPKCTDQDQLLPLEGSAPPLV